jgi:uncharacterized protein
MPSRSLVKPDRVFDRTFEWSTLSGFVTSSNPHARLGVVSGRRRQGKTFLLRAMAEATNGFYFTAAETTAVDSLREFGAALAEHAGTSAPYALTGWNDALNALDQTLPDGLAVIDEFPYLMKADRSIPSVIQRRLDERASRPSRTGPRLLLCGSAMSVMGGLLAANAPLRGRASLELVVNSFDYRTAARFWRLGDPKLAVLVHSVVGGTPAYRQEFVGGDAPESLAEFDDWVVRTVLNPAIPLFREARYLLAEETDIRDPALYNSVLGAIAAGNATRGGIANHVGRKSSELLHPLNVLEDCALIIREADPFHARRSSFRIAEPLVTFYEAIMRRAWTQLEQRLANRVWQRSRPTFLAKVVGPHFEALCRDWAARADEMTFGDLPGEVAAGTVADPVNRSQIQIDVAVLAAAGNGEPRRILSLGEVKWGTVMGLRHLERLRRARDLLSVKGYGTAETWLACYSGAGFDDELRAAVSRDRVLLVDLHRLYAD